MSRKTFYSFHYERDAWRAAQVRNSNVIPDEDEYGVIDAVEWEKIERQGDDAIERWISDQMSNTSVTVVLIGTETANRRWVKHEIRKSWERGNGLLGVRIHNIRNQDSETDLPGENPFEKIHLDNGNALSTYCKVYDWNADDGRANLGVWVEEAYQARDSYEGKVEASENDVDSQSPYPNIGPTIIKNPPRQWAV